MRRDDTGRDCDETCIFRRVHRLESVTVSDRDACMSGLLIHNIDQPEKQDEFTELFIRRRRKIAPA